MGFENDFAEAYLQSLGETFTLEELDRSMRHLRRRLAVIPREVQRTIECVRWLAESNYEVHFSAEPRDVRAHHFPGLLQ